MAKQTPFPTQRSKVRILFVEAELLPGELHELTASVASAIRPSLPARQPAAPHLLSPEAEGSSNGLPEQGQRFEVGAEVEEEGSEQAAEVKSAKRKYPTPKIVADLDINAGGKPFEAFAREKGATEHQSRYLVAAYWLDEYAKVSPVTMHHVYTCYRAANWVFDPVDPGFPFRKMKKDGFGDAKHGKFTINHIGRARVEKMGQA